MNEDPKLLNDEQVRRFVADGFIVLDVGLPTELHQEIADELHFSLKNESAWLGDNLLRRVPNIDRVLSCPVVGGALQSLLGPEFAWAPHRFPHNSEPLETDKEITAFDPFDNQPAMGKGSISGSGWHQDGHAKAARSRWHTFKAINMFYFPHDVPLEMGPTRLLAGTHLYPTLRNTVPSQVFLNPVNAGTVIIADFDVGHAGTPNRTTTSRYMLKFVALRTRNPQQPTWDHRDEAWQTPAHLLTSCDTPRTWATLWNWLQGKNHGANLEALPDSEIPRLLVDMDSPAPATRLSSMYELVRMGEHAVEPLLQRLLTTAGQNRHVSPAQNDKGYYANSPDHLERRFSQRQFVPEDSAIALGAIGPPSINRLVDLLNHEDPWIRVNAVYGLGEVGDALPQHVADQVGILLDDAYHQVVRSTADALCWLPYGATTIKRLLRRLTQSREDWQINSMGEPKLGGRWTIENHTRYVVAWALRARANAADAPAELEDAMLTALPLESGYTPAVLCQGLETLGTARALKAVVRYLQPRRWDAISSFAPTTKRKAA